MGKMEKRQKIPIMRKFFFLPPPKHEKTPQKGDNFFLKGFTAVFLSKIKKFF